MISCSGACEIGGAGPAFDLQKLINRPVLANAAPVDIASGVPRGFDTTTDLKKLIFEEVEFILID